MMAMQPKLEVEHWAPSPLGLLPLQPLGDGVGPSELRPDAPPRDACVVNGMSASGGARESAADSGARSCILLAPADVAHADGSAHLATEEFSGTSGTTVARGMTGQRPREVVQEGGVASGGVFVGEGGVSRVELTLRIAELEEQVRSLEAAAKVRDELWEEVLRSTVAGFEAERAAWEAKLEGALAGFRAERASWAEERQALKAVLESTAEEVDRERGAAKGAQAKVEELRMSVEELESDIAGLREEGAAMRGAFARNMAALVEEKVHVEEENAYLQGRFKESYAGFQIERLGWEEAKEELEEKARRTSEELKAVKAAMEVVVGELRGKEELAEVARSTAEELQAVKAAMDLVLGELRGKDELEERARNTAEELRALKASMALVLAELKGKEELEVKARKAAEELQVAKAAMDGMYLELAGLKGTIATLKASLQPESPDSQGLKRSSLQDPGSLGPREPDTGSMSTKDQEVALKNPIRDSEGTVEHQNEAAEGSGSDSCCDESEESGSSGGSAWDGEDEFCDAPSSTALGKTSSEGAFSRASDMIYDVLSEYDTESETTSGPDSDSE